MAHTHSTQSHHDAPSGTTERDVIDVKGIVGFAIGLVVVSLAVHLSMLLMFRVLANQAEASNPPRMYPLAALPTEPAVPGDPGGTQPPEPRLQTDPKQDLANLRAEEEQILTGYGWVDRNNNVVRIPIAEAMKLTLQRGLPARDASAAQSTPAAAAPATQAQGKEQGK